MRLGIELISVFGLPPVPFIELAAELGCERISAVLEPLAYNPENYPRYSLRENKALRRDVKTALADNGVSIGLGEGFIVRGIDAVEDPFVPGTADMKDRWATDLEIMAELGVNMVNAVCMEPDQSRAFDQLGLFADLSAVHGMVATLEFCPTLGIADLPTALRAVRHVGRKNFKLLLDPMHLIRSGGSVADLESLPAGVIAYAQLCDVPLRPSGSDYLEEAMYERLAPGRGALPLVEFIRALPPEITVGLEIPQRAPAAAGIRPRDRLKPVLEGARHILALAGV
jgi:sugar phosphate isomerase/epimerase